MVGRGSARGLLVGWAAAGAVSLAGTRVINVGVPWFVLTTTGNPGLAGLVALVQMLPMVLAKALCGPLIDRWGPIRLAVLGQAVSLVAVAAVPILAWLHALSIPALLVVVAVEGLARGPVDSANYALCPRIAAAAAQPVERITGIAGTIDRLGATVGAAVGGALIALVGAPTALLLSCGAFVVSALLLAYVVGPRLAPPTSVGSADGAPSAPASEPGATIPHRPSYLAQLRDGWSFLRHDAVLLSMVIMTGLTNLLEQAYASVLAPAWVLDAGRDAGTLGVIVATMTGAGLVGSVAASAWADRLPRVPTYVVSYVLSGAPRFLVLALGAPLPVILAVIALSGLAAGFVNPILGAIMFGRVPQELQGRVSSLLSAIAWAPMTLGGLVGGLLVVWHGEAVGLAIAALAYLLVTLTPTVLPAWRGVGRSPRAAEPGSRG